jgi:hypothetical protein
MMLAITPLPYKEERGRRGLHHRRRHCGRGFNLLAGERAKRHDASDRRRGEQYFAPERTATLNTDKNFAFEIRTINGDGAFVEAGTSLAGIVAAFAKIGEELTLLETGEAIRKDWVASIKEFTSRSDQPAKYHSVVKFAHPENGRTAEEWLTAKRDQIVGTRPKR